MKKENNTNTYVVYCSPWEENTLREKRVLTRAVVGQALPDNAPAEGHPGSFTTHAVAPQAYSAGYSKSSAFTFIELLVVILIIGILAAVAVPQYQKAVDKARTSELFAIAKNLKVQQEVFFLTNGYYAADCEELGSDLPNGFTSVENSSNYSLTKGNYEAIINCNTGNRVMTMIRDNPIKANATFNTHIEMFFDHYSDENVATSEQGFQGKAMCSATGNHARSLAVCKSLGKEQKNEKAWWL